MTLAEGMERKEGARAMLIASAGPILLALLLFARVDAPSALSAHARVFVAQELALVVAAALLAGVAAGSRLRVARDAALSVVAGLAVLEVLATAGASDPWLAIRSATVWIAGLVLFVVARACSVHAKARMLGLSGVLLPLGIAALTVIAEALGAIRLSATHHAPGGLLGERNVAAELLVVGAPLVGYVGLADGPSWRRRVALGVGALAVIAVVLTRTRSAWVAGIATIVVLGSLALRPGEDSKPRARRLLVVVALGIALALALPTRLRWRSAHPYRDSLVHLVDRTTASGGGRLTQYATTLRMAFAHPAFGVGPGHWAAHYLTYASSDDRTVHAGLVPVNRLPNSDVLGFAAERGIPAFALLIAFGVLLLRQRGPSSALVGLRRATLLALAIVATLDAVLQTPAALFLTAWVLGLSSDVTAEPQSSPSLRGPFAFGAAFVVLVFAAVPALSRARALDVAAHARGSDDLERATRLDPGDLALRLFTAQSWIADGRCDRARAHLDAVAKFSPSSPARAELATRCTSSATLAFEPR